MEHNTQEIIEAAKAMEDIMQILLPLPPKSREAVIQSLSVFFASKGV